MSSQSDKEPMGAILGDWPPAMDWMFVSHQNVYVKFLSAHVMILGDGAFGGQLGLD